MNGRELYMLDVMGHLDLSLVEAADGGVKRRGAVLLKYAVAVAAALLVIVTGALLFPFIKGVLPQETEPIDIGSSEDDTQKILLTLDVNQGVELEVRDGVVTSFKPTDPEGEIPVEESTIRGLSLEDAVRMLITAAVEKQYIRSEKDLAVLLMSTGEGSSVRRIVFEWTVDIAEGALGDEQLKECQGRSPLLSDEIAKKAADLYGVEKQQVQYLMNLFQQTSSAERRNRTEDLVYETVRIELYTATAFPEEDAEASQGLYYALEGDSYAVCGMGECDDVELVIPATHKGRAVSRIEEKAFQDCKYLKTVTILGQTSIGSAAFSGCDNLTTVTLAGDVSDIGSYAFAFCYALQKIDFGKGVKSIGEGAFHTCDRLEGVVLPDGLESIGVNAFSVCDGITSIVIPASVTRIDRNAFLYLEVFCEAESRPEGWSEQWTGSYSPVHWRDSWEYVDGVPTLK